MKCFKVDDYFIHKSVWYQLSTGCQAGRPCGIGILRSVRLITMYVIICY